MTPNTSLDAIKKRYLDDFESRGINLNSQQLEKLNSYIIKEYQASQAPLRQEPLTPSRIPRQTNTAVRDESSMISSMAQRVSSQPQEDSESLSHLNKLGVGLWYGLESYLWEAPGYALDKMGINQPYDWEKLTPGEKATAVAAGGAALFAPGFGGFRGLAKLGQKVVSRTATKGTVKQARTTAGQAIRSGITAETRLQNKGLNQSLRKGWDDVLGKSNNHLIAIQASKKGRTDAVAQLEANLHSAAYKSLKEAGVKGTDAELLQMAGQLTNGAMTQIIKNKKSVNSISEWIHELAGAGSSSALKSSLSKYFGMAVQDAYMLGTHSMVSSYLAAAKHDQEWMPTKAFTGAMAMSVAFPALRAIKGGGEMTIGRGVKFAWDKWKTIDYKAMVTESGEGAVRHSLRMLLNRTDISNRAFEHLGNKTGRSILNKIDDMPIDDVIKTLNIVRKQVASEGLKKFASRYPGDLLNKGSLTRMALGAGMMNFESFKTGAYEYMDTEELFAHMIVGAVMSRGRGEWARENMKADQIDYARYDALMQHFGIRGNQLKGLFNTWKLTDEVNTVLASKEAQPLLDIFSAYKNRQKKLVTGEMDLTDHKIVADLAALYNTHLYAGAGGGLGYEPFIVQNFSKKDLNNIKRQLLDVEIGGKKIGDLGFEGTKNKLSIEFSNRVERIYADMLSELQSAGAPVAVEYGKDGKPKIIHAAQIRFPKDSKDSMDGIVALDALLQRFREDGVSTATTSLNLDTLDKEQMANVDLKKIDKIIKRYEKKLPQMVYGKNIGMMEPIESNRFLESLSSGRQIEAIDKIYNLMVDRYEPTDVQSSNFMEGFKNLFYRKGRTIEDFDKQVELEPLKKGSKESDKEFEMRQKARDEEFAEIKNDLSQINTLRKVAEDTGSHKETVRVTLDEIKRLHDSYQDITSRFPEQMRMAGVERVGLEYFIHRFTENKDIPVDLYNLYEAAAMPEVGLIKLNAKTGKAFMPNRKLVEHILGKEGHDIKSEYYQQTLERHRDLEKRLNKVGVESNETFIVGDQIAKQVTSKDINALWESQQVDSAKNLANSAMKSINKLEGTPGFQLQLDRIKDIYDNQIDGEINIENRVNSLRGMLEVLDEISTGKFGQHEHIKKSVDTARRQITKYIKKHTQKNVVIDGNRMSVPDFVMDAEQGNLFIKSVRDALDIGLKEELVYRDRMRSTLLDLFSGAITGDVTKEMAYKQSGELRRVLLESINKNTKEMTLEEAIETYDRIDSWKNLMNVTQTAMEVINKSKTFNNPEAFFKSNAQQLSDLLDLKQRRSDVRTPIQIAKEWGLTDKSDPNKVSTDIIDKLATSSNPGQELANIVKENLAKDKTLTSTGRIAKLQEFTRKDGLTMLSYFVNSTRIKKASWKNGYLVYDINESTFSNGTIDFLKQFDFFLLDESGTSPTTKGRSRRFQWGMEFQDEQSPLNQETFNNLVKEGKLVPKTLEEQIYIDERYDSSIAREGMPNSLSKDGFNGTPIFMRVGSKAILFINDPKGVNAGKLNDKFNEWYDRHSSGLGRKEGRESFINMWEGVKNGPDSPENLSLKMSVVSIDEVLNKRFMEEYLHRDLWKDSKARTKFESKLFQRSLIADASGQKMRKSVLQYMNKRRGVFSDLKNDPNHGDILKHYLTTDVKVGVLTDEQVKGEWQTDSPFHIKSVVDRVLTEKANNQNLSPEQRENARMFRDELRADALLDKDQRKYPSIDASSIDGVEYVSERFAKLLWAMKGKEWGDFNGVKPYIFDNGANSSLIAKGYFVYDPNVSRIMGDMDIMMGESSAKIYGGKSWSGGQMTPRQLTSRTNDWVSEIANNRLNGNEQLRINIENISLGVANGDKNAASRSHTITDYQNREFIKEARIWQELDNILQQTIDIERSSQRGNHLLSEIIRTTKESEGYEYTEGAAGLAMDIIAAGGSSNNPIIRKSVTKLVQGPMMDILRTSNSEHSVDAMLAPDVMSELSMPIFAKVVSRGAAGSPDKVVNRVQLELGETRIPHALGEKKIRNFGKQTLVYNSGGIDVLVSPSVRKEGSNVHRDGTERLGSNETLIDNNGNHIIRRRDSQDAEFVDKIIGGLRELYGTSTAVKLKHLHNAIESLKDNGTARYGNDFFNIRPAEQARLKKIKLSVSVSGHPIPRVGLDLSPLRVQGIGTRAEGNIAKINHFDLRTGYQRDHDGDRFYLHHDMGVKMMDMLRGRYSNVTDYPQLPKNNANINIFGLDGNGVAGKQAGDIGFNKYQATIQQQKMNVGRAISMKSILTTLSNSELSFNKESMKKLGDLNYAEGEGRGQSWWTLERMMRLNQSSVDVHTGLNHIAESPSRDAIMDAILFGIKPDNMPDQLAREFGITPDNALFGSKTKWNLAEMSVIKELIGHVKKSSRIFNDVYDEGGQRSPLDYELRDAYNSLRLVYGDKKALNKSLFDSSFKKAIRKREYEKAEQLIELFYGDRAMPELRDFLTKNNKTSKQMHRMVNMMYIKGENQFDKAKMNMPIDFGSHKNITDTNDRAKARIRDSNAGYILDKMMKTNTFVVEGSHWGNTKLKQRNKIGLAASDLVENWDMIRTMYEVSGETVPSPDVILEKRAYQAFNMHNKKWSVTDAQKRGALKVALESEKRQLSRALRFERSDKYRFDANKIEALERKIDNVNTMVNYIEKLGYNDLVKNTKNYKLRPSNKKQEQRFERQKVYKNAHVYRVRGKYSDSGKAGDVDFSKLEFVESVPEGKTYGKERGYSYIELFDAISPTNMDANTLRHSYALLQRTVMAEPRDFFKDRTREEQFIGGVRRLIGLINNKNHESSMMYKQNKSVSPIHSSIAKSEIHHAITSLFKQSGIITKDNTIVDAEAFNMALRYIIQPRSVEGFYRVGAGKDKMDIPTFRMNNRLIQEMLDWSFNSGHEVSRLVAKDLVKDWTKTVEHEKHTSEIGIDMMKNIYGKDYYTSSIRPELADLARHMAGYNDPLIKDMFNKAGLVRGGKERVIDLIEQSDVYIKRLHTEKMKGNWCR